MEENGFYKLDIDNNDLLYGPNFVYHRDYEIFKEYKDTYTFPVDGWYWFETYDEAYNFLINNN